MSNRVFVVGVGMSKFMKPKKTNPDYPEFGKQAVERALRDSGLPYSKIELAVCAYAYGDSCCGQAILYQVGMTGIPIYNVHNAGSTGATGLNLTYNLVKSGVASCAMALGFEKMPPGKLPLGPKDRVSAFERLHNQTDLLRPVKMDRESPAPTIFGNAGIEHQELYGTKDEHFAKIAVKNHLHSMNNPYSQNRQAYTLEEIMQSQKVYGPLTKLQCCPNSDAAACAILANEKFIKEHGLEDQAVEIMGMVLRTDPEATFAEKTLRNISGYSMCKLAARDLYKQTGITPEQVQVIELHDCFSTNELITYEAIGLCPEGKAGEYIDKNTFTYGGKWVVNPSGGLISKGHPLGATGIAQCSELCWQLRGMALKRQVPNCKIGMQQTIGLGGACVMAIYKKYNDKKGWKREDQTSDPDVLEKFEKSAGVKAKLVENFKKEEEKIIPSLNQIRPKL